MKIVLVTGGSSGIGLQTVLAFQQAGYRVISCSRDENKWNHALAMHPELSAVDYLPVDLKDVHQTDRFFGYIRESYGHLDIAINNASPKLESRGEFASVPIDALYSTMVTDFWIHALCLRYELNLMPEGSAIVNLSSVNGIRPTPNAAMYSAAKHGIEGITRSVAVEAIRKGIRVNAIAPGVTWTPRWEQQQAELDINLRETVSRQVPSGRFASPEEIASAILWLSSEKAGYIVGHTLVIDGGLSLS
ncbi:SDR family NAD(P)-dependent oxidoreductase [Enterovibrio nigricans]|uniref:NAD(P)-dependent dehydrogenase, short-chain alcohol dehydrogenase family n=1 Tax=Enterovibrio nigricans DSM 22720 TaxID=1121868 RepID=A0A1T4VCW6_9GAMM|nr:SDR family oxidoreductase [Enterovibrio nigricans]PKF49261.1 NAD(P)-dependent oxidoreductase [Enterovibrio nigricans]SKA62804.1 NAD(P)-dependent dehydrogenase, short-chain alcohol dehydrogenase family [Enterovibrio nigricans DSM 22720]